MRRNAHPNRAILESTRSVHSKIALFGSGEKWESGFQADTTAHPLVGTPSPTSGVPKLDKVHLIYDFYLMSVPTQPGKNFADNVTD